MWTFLARRFAIAGVLLTASLVFAAGRPEEGRASPPRSGVDTEASYLVAITGKAGLFGFAAHDHAILATNWSASLNMNPAELAGSQVTIVVPTAALVIDSRAARERARLGGGPSASDVRTIQQRMLSGEVLDAARYPQIRFTSTAIEDSGSHTLVATGELELHGRRRHVTFPVRYRFDGPKAEFDGELKVRQTDYGIEPARIAGGIVKVKDTVTIRFHIVATGAD